MALSAWVFYISTPNVTLCPVAYRPAIVLLAQSIARDTAPQPHYKLCSLWRNPASVQMWDTLRYVSSHQIRSPSMTVNSVTFDCCMSQAEKTQTKPSPKYVNVTCVQSTCKQTCRASPDLEVPLTTVQSRAHQPYARWQRCALRKVLGCREEF
jgi:hypothetical protein